jgi:hypothetical protein
MSEDFQRVQAVGEGGDLSSDIAAWIDSPPMRALVVAFAEAEDVSMADLDLATRLDRLDSFTERWDTRQGRERDQADELPLTPEQDELVMRAVTALGFRDSGVPRHDRYDHILMLGGLFRACITRPAHAANLIRSGMVSTSSVTALGGHRPFSEQERALAERAGFGELNEEFAALDAGVRKAFGLDDPSSTEGERFDSPGGSWSLHSYDTDGGLTVRVAAAPSGEPALRRANTEDSYKWWANKVAKLGPRDRILAVTTAIYVPAQHAAAVRMLSIPFGAEVETVGIEPGDVNPALAQPFTPTKYLLEIRSAIRSLRDLFVAIQPAT